MKTLPDTRVTLIWTLLKAWLPCGQGARREERSRQQEFAPVEFHADHFILLRNVEVLTRILAAFSR
jgi:hypothetical protein